MDINKLRDILGNNVVELLCHQYGGNRDFVKTLDDVDVTLVFDRYIIDALDVVALSYDEHFSFTQFLDEALIGTVFVIKRMVRGEDGREMFLVNTDGTNRCRYISRLKYEYEPEV